MTMTSERTDRAIARIQGQSNKAIKQVFENATRMSDKSLIDACWEELRARGTFDMSDAQAKQMVEAIARTTGKSLEAVIEIAFTDVPAKSEEILILRWIAHNPGTTFAATEKAYGRNDLGLVIGHLIHYRFGYFRPFITTKTQSDLLLMRTTSSVGTCYTLRAEAAEALKKSVCSKRSAASAEYLHVFGMASETKSRWKCAETLDYRFSVSPSGTLT